MKEAFYRGDFVKLKYLVNTNHSKEAYFYQAIMAENGLAGEVDVEFAKKAYVIALTKGELQAGINLAKIFLKEKQVNEAKEILKKIVESDKEKFKQYASYLLDVLDAKDIIENFDLKLLSKKQEKEKIIEAKQLSENFSNYIQGMKENTFIYFETKYNKAKLDLCIAEREIELKRIELEKENLVKIEEFKKANANKGNISGLVAKFKHELQDNIEKELQKNKIFLEAKKTLEIIAKNPQAQNISNQAKSLLKSLEIKKNIEQKNYEEAIEECDSLLSKDFSNSDIKMLKFSALSYDIDQKNVLDYEKFDQAMQLVREVKRDDPDNKQAIRREVEMQNKLIRKIGEDIVGDLKEKSAYFDDKFNSAWLKGFGYKDDTKQEREKFIDSLGPMITAALTEGNYIKNNLSFSESRAASKELSDRIWLNISSTIENNWNNIVPFIRGGNEFEGNYLKVIKNMNLDSKIATQISSWDKSHKSLAIKDLSANQINTIKKYNKFKEALSQKLDDYYIRCKALTDPEGDLEAKVVGNFSGVIDFVSKVTPIVGVATKSVAVSAAGVVLKTFDDLSIEGKKAALYASAKEFCNISNNSADANKKFNYIAEKIVEEYGMQIENVVSEDVEKLANVAAEKMLDKFRNASITDGLWDAFADPAKTAVEFLQSSLGVQSEIIKSPERTLLEGVRSGKTKKNQEINTEDGRVGNDKWIAHEVFDNPVVTSDGENFYCTKGADKESNKYGARFAEHRDYIKKEVSPKDKKEMGEAFRKHVKIVNSSAWISKENKKEKNKKDLEISSEDLSRKKRELKAKRLVGIVVIIAGAAAIAASAVAATAVAASIFTANVAYVAVVGGALGLGGFIKGFKGVSVASDGLHKLEKQKTAISIDVAAKKVMMEEQKIREELFKNTSNNFDVEASLISQSLIVLDKDNSIKGKWKSSAKKVVEEKAHSKSIDLY